MSILVQAGIFPVVEQSPLAMAAEPQAIDVAVPKHKEEVYRLRWEVEHKMSKKRRCPLTEAQLQHKQAQIDAYEKQWSEDLSGAPQEDRCHPREDSGCCGHSVHLRGELSGSEQGAAD